MSTVIRHSLRGTAVHEFAFGSQPMDQAVVITPAVHQPEMIRAQLDLKAQVPGALRSGESGPAGLRFSFVFHD